MAERDDHRDDDDDVGENDDFLAGDNAGDDGELICPFCGDTGHGCEHVVALGSDDDQDVMCTFADWGTLDELAHDIDRLTVDGRSALDSAAGTQKFWWMTRRGAGAGISQRLVSATVFAHRFGLTHARSGGDEGAGLFAADRDAVTPRIAAVITRSLAELRALGARLGYEPDPV